MMMIIVIIINIIIARQPGSQAARQPGRQLGSATKRCRLLFGATQVVVFDDGAYVLSSDTRITVCMVFTEMSTPCVSIIRKTVAVACLKHAVVSLFVSSVQVNLRNIGY